MIFIENKWAGKHMINYFKLFILSTVLAGFLSAHAQSYEQFFRAIEFDDAQVVQQLLRKGFDPNTPSPELQPGLTLALQKKSLKVAETLIAWRSIDVNRRNASDESPLMLAALHGHLRLAEQLIARGADVNKTGWTPLHYAATGGHVDLVQLLLEHHAYIDAESPNGTTPLMMAAHYGTPTVTQLLLEEGADLTLKNQKGLTAYDFAYANPNKAALALITKALQARPSPP